MAKPKAEGKNVHALHTEILDNMHKIYVSKNTDYGNSAYKTFKEFGVMSYVIRLTDKLNRLKSLTALGSTRMVTDESLMDTLMDMANYSVMAMMDIISERNEGGL